MPTGRGSTSTRASSAAPWPRRSSRRWIQGGPAARRPGLARRAAPVDGGGDAARDHLPAPGPAAVLRHGTARAAGPGGRRRFILEWARAGHVGRETLSGARACRTGSRPATCPRSRRILPPPPTSTRRPAGAPVPLGAGGGARSPAPSRALPTAREARPAPDRDGPCPLCGDAEEDGREARMLYDHWICRKCSNGLVNRRQFAWLLDILALWGVMFVLGVRGRVLLGACGGPGRGQRPRRRALAALRGCGS